MSTGETMDLILKCLNSIEAFNTIAGNLNKPVDPNLEYKMLKEEVLEYFEAYEQAMQQLTPISESKMKDAAADIMVVLWGTILKHGWKNSFFAILAEVCKSNMTKFPITADEAQQTVEKYRQEGINVNSEFNPQFEVYVVKREDGKIMKSINFQLPQI